MTVYTFGELKEQLNSNRNRNVRVVKTKTQHICLECSAIIETGQKCVTVNKLGYRGRYWVCKRCVLEDLRDGIVI